MPCSGFAHEGASERRRRRIERELRALHAMQDHLRTRDLVWAVLAIPLLISLCALVAFKLSWFGASAPAALAGAAVAGFVIWFIGRRWFALAALIVVALVCIVFETSPSNGAAATTSPTARSSAGSSSNAPIATREALLERP